MKKKDIRKLISELEQMQLYASECNRGVDENAQYGNRNVTQESKIRDEAKAAAYAYCLIRLRQLVED